PTKISSAIANKQANTPVARPRQKEWRKHRVPSGSRAVALRYSLARSARPSRSRQRESVRFQNLPASATLQESQESSRAFFVLSALENHSTLLNRRMHICWNFPAFTISHRRGDCQRQRENSRLRTTRRHELCGLRDIFAVDESPADLVVDSGATQRRNGSTSIRRMLRIGDGDPLNAGLKECLPAKLREIRARLGRHPDYDPPDR